MHPGDSPSSFTQPDPPYTAMQPDDPAAVEPARRRVTGTKGPCLRLLSSLRSKLRAPKPSAKKPDDRGPCSVKDDFQPLPPLLDEAQSIVIQTDSLPDLSEAHSGTIYRWAVLYENQRG